MLTESRLTFRRLIIVVRSLQTAPAALLFVVRLRPPHSWSPRRAPAPCPGGAEGR